MAGVTAHTKTSTYSIYLQATLLSQLAARGACCASCLNRVAKQWNRKDARLGSEAQGQLVSLLEQCSELRSWSALQQRRQIVCDRLADLRVQAGRRAESLTDRRGLLSTRREALQEQRRRHEARATEWLAARRRLEAKRAQFFRVSRDQFLRNPAEHSAQLGAFHIYQELSVVTLALQEERRRRCGEIVANFPLKWIQMGSSAADCTVTLGQVHSFGITGVLQDDELQNLEAALALLMRLVSSLARCLDLTLPFPCSGGRGFREVSMAVQAATAAGASSAASGGSSLSSFRLGHAGTGGGDAQTSSFRLGTGGGGAGTPSSSPGRSVAQWVLPCVLHPFAARWRYFSVYDNICTSEFALCICQGENPAPLLADGQSTTLQLLALLLSAAHLGCIWPPPADLPMQRTEASRSGALLLMPVGSSDLEDSHDEDGDWTVLTG
ncbi:unnamed protein product [Polarella glacialis]|uniref:Uncharacterized protein n=1 Tax=Polarella glacialis TaxID=89957 RepID=A0A813HCI9_POLGL|nr:unnamed protein product [Polarella glacialis]